MTPLEEQRYLMHSAFRETHGEKVAGVIMEHLPPSGWSHLASRDDTTNLRVQLSADMEILRADVTSDMQMLRVELRGEMAELRGDMQLLRSELREEMHKLHVSGLRWTVGLVFMGNAALLAVASFLN